MATTFIPIGPDTTPNPVGASSPTLATFQQPCGIGLFPQPVGVGYPVLPGVERSNVPIFPLPGLAGVGSYAMQWLFAVPFLVTFLAYLK